MSKKIFNPADWTTQNTKTSKPRTSEKSSFPPLRGGQEGLSDIDLITQRIEAVSVDIAPNYADWRDLGFALADALGESGRNYFHRLSRFYPSYSQSETDKQYSACLASHGHGVTVKTLYHLAKSAGINVGIPKVKESKPNSKVADKAEIEDMSDEELFPSPNGEGSGVRCFPPEIFDQLPDLLRRITVKGTSPLTCPF